MNKKFKAFVEKIFDVLFDIIGILFLVFLTLSAVKTFSELFTFLFVYLGELGLFSEYIILTFKSGIVLFLSLIVMALLFPPIIRILKQITHKEPYCTIKVYPDKKDENMCISCANKYSNKCPLKVDMQIISESSECNPLVTECKYYKRGKFNG